MNKELFNPFTTILLAWCTLLNMALIPANSLAIPSFVMCTILFFVSFYHSRKKEAAECL